MRLDKELVLRWGPRISDEVEHIALFDVDAIAAVQIAHGPNQMPCATPPLHASDHLELLWSVALGGLGRTGGMRLGKGEHQVIACGKFSRANSPNRAAAALSYARAASSAVAKRPRRRFFPPHERSEI